LRVEVVRFLGFRVLRARVRMHLAASARDEIHSLGVRGRRR